jgi:hypothetical protein
MAVGTDNPDYIILLDDKTIFKIKLDIKESKSVAIYPQ